MISVHWSTGQCCSKGKYATIASEGIPRWAIASYTTSQGSNVVSKHRIRSRGKGVEESSAGRNRSVTRPPKRRWRSGNSYPMTRAALAMAITGVTSQSPLADPVAMEAPAQMKTKPT